jgi:hypothetical protein
MSDKLFLEFIRRQDTCLPRWAGDKSRTVAAHVRRSSNSGTGTKPEYSAIPLTDEQHRYQHQQGETALVNRCLGENMDRHEAHQIIDEKAQFYLMQFWDGAVA